jgi:hypothetical protein
MTLTELPKPTTAESRAFPRHQPVLRRAAAPVQEIRKSMQPSNSSTKQMRECADVQGGGPRPMPAAPARAPDPPSRELLRILHASQASKYTGLQRSWLRMQLDTLDHSVLGSVQRDQRRTGSRQERGKRSRAYSDQATAPSHSSPPRQYVRRRDWYRCGSVHAGCFNAVLSIGSFRTRLPVAAKIALVTAGTTAEVPGSPIPPGDSELRMMWTSIAGASFMRRIW